MNHPENYMDLAIQAARESLRAGDSGFGAVIVKDDVVVSKARDTDKTSKDPTAHAELTAIRRASVALGGDFSDCMLVATHEPCPMCAAAIVWAGIRQVAFGTSIRHAINQGRTRIDLSCEELFRRAGAPVDIIAGVKHEACGILYNDQVRQSVRQLRNTDDAKLARLSENLSEKRLQWFRRQKALPADSDPLAAGYRLFIQKLGITAEDAPIVERRQDRIVIHSKNFCPTLEACTILGLDTRVICRQLSEAPTRDLLRQLDSRLGFTRNYHCLRPYTPYCEEMITLDEMR